MRILFQIVTNLYVSAHGKALKWLLHSRQENLDPDGQKTRNKELDILYGALCSAREASFMCLRLPQCAADEESNEIFICVCVGQVKEEFKTNHLLSNPLPSPV